MRSNTKLKPRQPTVRAAFEATVALDCNNHPSVDIDAAKATVLDAIGARTP